MYLYTIYEQSFIQHGVDFRPRPFFFYYTLEPRVEVIQRSMSIKYEPSSESLHIPAK